MSIRFGGSAALLFTLLTVRFIYMYALIALMRQKEGDAWARVAFFGRKHWS